jgi:transglutaminase-like putative cysteine protease
MCLLDLGFVGNTFRFENKIKRHHLIFTFSILLIIFLTLSSASTYASSFKGLLKPSNISNSAFKVLNYANYTITYTINLFIPAGSRVELRVAMLQSMSPYQIVSLVSSSYAISNVLIDEYGNRVAVIQLPQSYTSQNIRVSMIYRATLFQVNCSIDPSGIGVYDTSSREYSLYTKPEQYIECNDLNIIEKAREIVGSESNAYYAAYKLFTWVYKNIKYEYESEVRGALTTLFRGSGACDEHAYLLTALCRAVGIPARYVSGYGFYLDEALTGSFTPKKEGHAWVEILLPNYGWIFADPTWGLFAESDLFHVAFRRGVESSLLGSGRCYYYYYGSKPQVSEELYILVTPLDSDGDGLTNLEEYKFGTNAFSVDTDADGLSDYSELKVYHTNPLKADTDGDGLMDSEEIFTFKTDPLLADSDGDGLSDGFEVKISKTNPLNPDSDGDGLDDYLEVMVLKSNPFSGDTDGDLWPDDVEYMLSPLMIFNLKNFFLPNFAIIGLIFVIIAVKVATRSKH